MKRLTFLMFIVLVGMLVACGPSAEELAVTYVAQTAAAATDTPRPPTNTPQPTNTPTETPLPTATPLPFAEIKELGVSEGEVLFEDDFETGFGDKWDLRWGSWRVVDEEGVEDNKVYFSDTGESMPPLWISREWTNYQADLQIKVLDFPEDNSTVSVKFRHATGSGCPAYNVGFNRDGIGLYRSDDSCNGVRNLGWLNEPILRNEWVDLRIVAVDEIFLVYLDEVLIHHASDDKLPNGAVSFTNWQGGEAYFDDVRIVELISD